MELDREINYMFHNMYKKIVCFFPRPVNLTKKTQPYHTCLNSWCLLSASISYNFKLDLSGI